MAQLNRKMMMQKWFLCSVLLAYCGCDGYKILTIFPMPSKSHNILGTGLVRLLLNAGHEVTHITPFVKRDPHPNLHVVDVTENFNAFHGNVRNLKAIMNQELNLKDIDFTNDMMSNISINTLENPKVMKLLQDPKQKFDLVIAEWLFSEAYCVFSAVFDVPLIWVSTIEPHWLIMRLIDEPLNPAYNADYIDLLQPPFTFAERFNVLWYQIKGLLSKEFKYYYKEEAAYLRSVVPILKKRGKPIPSYQELIYNASLVLGNSHLSLGSSIRLPVNYIPIAGYHIDDQAEPLPVDLKKIMDNAKNGVIYFGMGSTLKSKDLPRDIKQGLLEMFGELKQTVIWKVEETLENVPENVHIVSWAPQLSILSHPNCVLFVTHGGLLSLTESIYHGVPVVVMPVYGDQFVNAARVAHKGYGIGVKLSYDLHKDIRVAIEEVLGNPKYAQKAKELSFVYHNRVATPGQEILHWVNHVIKTKGAPHLRSPALQVPLYQKLYLDLILVLIIIAIGIIFVIRRLLYTLSIKKLDRKKIN